MNDEARSAGGWNRAAVIEVSQGFDDLTGLLPEAASTVKLSRAEAASGSLSRYILWFDPTANAGETTSIIEALFLRLMKAQAAGNLQVLNVCPWSAEGDFAAIRRSSSERLPAA